MRKFTITLLGGLALAGFLVMPSSKASPANHKIILTFSEPVQIPNMVLNPGTYIIQRVRDPEPNALEVLSSDGRHLYEMFLARPVERPQPTSNVVVVFDETRQGEPEILRTFYYPGDVVGEQPVYPKSVMSQSANANNPEVNVPQANTTAAVTNVPEPVYP